MRQALRQVARRSSAAGLPSRGLVHRAALSTARVEEPPRRERAGSSSAVDKSKEAASSILASGGSEAPSLPAAAAAAAPATPSRAVAVAWLSHRKAKQEAAVLEASALLQSGTATGDAATASLNVAMTSCGEIGLWAQALALYERMVASGVPVHQRSGLLAMKSAMHLGRYEMALAVWARMRDAGVPAQREEYTVTMSACERLGQWERALALFDEMAERGVTPDTNTMGVAILACERGGQAARANELLLRMEALGGRPPTALYNSALRACAASERRGGGVGGGSSGGVGGVGGGAGGDSADALLAAELCSRMRRLGVARDLATYRVAVAACAAGGLPARGKLLSLVDALLQEPPARVRGWTADEALCTAALEACADAGHWRGWRAATQGRP